MRPRSAWFVCVGLTLGWCSCCSTVVPLPEINIPKGEKLQLEVLVESSDSLEFHQSVNNRAGYPSIELRAGPTTCTELLAEALFENVTIQSDVDAGKQQQFDAVFSVTPGQITQVDSAGDSPPSLNGLSGHVFPAEVRVFSSGKLGEMMQRR